MADSRTQRLAALDIGQTYSETTRMPRTTDPTLELYRLRNIFAPAVARTGLRFKVHTSVAFTRDYKEILVTISATRTPNAP